MKRLAGALALLAMAACCASSRSLMDEFKRSQPWDVFYWDRTKVKVVVIRADKWEFRDGCFIAEEPVPYIQCEVIRIRPCTEDCG